MPHLTEQDRANTAMDLLDALPEPVGDDRWDAARVPATPMERGAVERAWVALFAVPRERRRRLRSVLDYFWDSGLQPVAVLFAAGYHAGRDQNGPWNAPLELPTPAAIAEHLVCTRSRADVSPDTAAAAWRLAFWLDDDGRPLPPPV